MRLDFFKRKGLLIVVPVLLAAVLASCGTPATPTDTPTHSPTTPATEAPATTAPTVRPTEAVEATEPVKATAPADSESAETPTKMAQGDANHLMEAANADAVSFHPYLTTDTASGSYQSLVLRVRPHAPRSGHPGDDAEHGGKLGYLG